MTQLSVNVNKIALLRNARGRNFPDLLAFSERFLDLGAAGITVHPRPDQRHVLQSAPDWPFFAADCCVTARLPAPRRC